jgi:EAL domain-containing protein (putative c-di-GMP-specific phosphodiesterase class I)
MRFKQNHRLFYSSNVEYHLIATNSQTLEQLLNVRSNLVLAIRFFEIELTANDVMSGLLISGARHWNHVFPSQASCKIAVDQLVCGYNDLFTFTVVAGDHLLQWIVH